MYLYCIWIYDYIYIYVYDMDLFVYIYTWICIYTPRPGEGRHIGAWGYINHQPHISIGTYIILCNIYTCTHNMRVSFRGSLGFHSGFL